MAPKVHKSASVASLTEEGLRANKTLLIGRRIKIHFPTYVISWGKVIEYDVIKDVYELEFSVDGKTHYMFGFPPKNGVTPKLPSEVAQCL